MVPFVRGKAWTIDECLYGNKEEGKEPVRELVNKASQFPGLIETIKEIENLVSGRGGHASGFYLFNDNFIEQNSLMKSPNGIETTCWDQGDSDYCGALKVDFLTVKGMDLIRNCMDFLLQDGLIEWQGTLRKTYDKYFHPAVIHYDDPAMWEMAADGKITSLFQFDTLTGGEAIKKIRPTTLKQLSLSNSVMRLMGDDTLNPIDRYTAFKNDIGLWYQEMDKAGLNKDEVAVLERYLLRNYGNSIEQEDIMELSMEPKISGFDIILANKLRKAVAKKKTELVSEVQEKFFSMGLERGNREVFLNYVWDYMVKPQLG